MAAALPDDYDGNAGALANRHIQMHTAGVARSIELARHRSERSGRDQVRTTW
jgi:hypothetical protein